MHVVSAQIQSSTSFGEDETSVRRTVRRGTEARKPERKCFERGTHTHICAFRAPVCLRAGANVGTMYYATCNGTSSETPSPKGFGGLDRFRKAAKAVSPEL